MFKTFRMHAEMKKNHARIEELHTQLKEMLTDPSLDPKAPFPVTEEYKTLENEYTSLVRRNVDLLHELQK